MARQQQQYLARALSTIKSGWTNIQTWKDLGKGLVGETNLTKLDLCAKRLLDEDIELIVAGLKQNTSVRTLLLNGNWQLTKAGWKHIAELVQTNTRLTALNLGYCGIQSEGFKHICQALNANTHLEEICFDNNSEIGDQALPALFDAIKNNKILRKLSVVHIPFSDENFNLFVDALIENNTIAQLDLSKIELNNNKAVDLARLLEKNTALKMLKLDKHLLNDPGMKTVSKAITENSSLTHIDISGNHFSTDGLVAFINALKTHPSIQSCTINGCQDFNDEGATAIVNLLEQTTVLTSFKCTGNDEKFSPDAVETIKEAIINKRFATIEIGGLDNTASSLSLSTDSGRKLSLTGVFPTPGRANSPVNHTSIRTDRFICGYK